MCRGELNEEKINIDNDKQLRCIDENAHSNYIKENNAKHE